MLKQSVQFIKVCQQIFCPFVIDHAVLRQADATRGPVQQLGAKAVFKGLNLPRNAAFRQR